MPTENLTYTKIDDNSFYLTQDKSELYTIDGLQGQIASLQADIASIQREMDAKIVLLQGATAAGVANASALLDTASGLSTQLAATIVPAEVAPAPPDVVPTLP